MQVSQNNKKIDLTVCSGSVTHSNLFGYIQFLDEHTALSNAVYVIAKSAWAPCMHYTWNQT